MDTIDLNIIEALKTNGRATASEISKKVSLSIPAVAERIRKLEQSRTIEKYTVKLNRQQLNLNLTAFIFVKIEKTKHIENFRTNITKHNCVLECHHVAGQEDYLLKIVVKDTAQLEDFLTTTLKKIDGVVSSNTIICLSTLKEEINN